MTYPELPYGLEYLPPHLMVPFGLTTIPRYVFTEDEHD